MAVVDVAYNHLMHEAPVHAILLLFFPLVLLLVLDKLFARGGGNSQKAKRLRLPPSPRGLPVIGHLHLVGERPQVSLCELAKRHSHDGLMLLRLGTVPNLVVSSPGAAQEVMRTHDRLFASRPPSMVADVLLYGSSDVALAPYGEHWRQVRKLVTTHLLSVRKVQSYRLARLEEVKLVIAKIHEAAATSTAVDMGEAMNTFTNDVVCRTVSGKFFRAEDRNKMFRELIAMNSALAGGFNLEDYFPGLAKVDLLARFLRNNNKAKKVNKRWDDLLEHILNDHEIKSTHHGSGGDGSSSVEQEEGDFIDVLLSVQQEYGITRDHMKAILMDMFGAGTDTSSFVLELAMLELMRHPELMAKLQCEVRSNTPKGKEMVEEEDLAGGLTYLKAVVQETLRLHPPAPLLLPHLSMADCEVNGYTIPSGTRVIINAWSIGRDPRLWEKPEEFKPERFIEGGSAMMIDFRGNDFQFLPFGAGRRICPGINFGLATIEIMLANLMYCFNWEMPTNVKREDIDMTEVFGVTLHRKEKLMLLPRSHVVTHVM